jgi:hypothetical protein
MAPLAAAIGRAQGDVAPLSASPDGSRRPEMRDTTPRH